MAGLFLARAVFGQLDSSSHFRIDVQDGECVPAGARLARLHGPAAPILTGERLALNLLQRLSGIATITRRYADAIAGTGASVSDTRKTTPGLRRFEKYAVRVGGGRNHRFGLYDAVLVKDNHVAAAGGIGPALRAAEAASPRIAPGPARGRLAGPAGRGPGRSASTPCCSTTCRRSGSRLAVARIRQHPRGAACWIEASGGITLENMRAYGEAGVDTISVGALTHSAPSVDIALDFDPPDG